MIPTCALTVNVSMIAGGVVAGATVRAVLSGPEVYEGVVLADGITATTDGSGNAELELFPNANGLLGSYYALTVEREGLADQVLYVIVPAQPTATLDDCETSRRPYRFTGTSAIPMGGPVTSFNTRRGDIVLTEDDVADALAGVDDAAARPTDADPLLELAAGATPVARAWSDVQAYVLGLPWRMPADTDADVTSYFKAQHDYALAQGLGFVRWKPRKDGKPWRVGMIAWHPSISIVCEGVPRFEAIDNIPLVNIARRVETSPGVYEVSTSAPADQRAFIYLLARAPFTEGQSINTPSTEGYKFTISGALIYDGNKGGQTANGGTTYNPASFIYAERGKNDPDYDEVAAANGDAKAYDCFRLEHAEVYNTSGTAFYGGPDRQRGHISGKCRATGCGVVSAGVVKTEARGYEWRGNDCITDSGFGGGGNTGEGGYFGGNSGAMFVHGNYWNQNPYMPDAATAFTLANVNGAVALSNVFNASLVATVSASAANAKKGIAVLGNDCRIADELFLPDRASGDPLGVADISKNAAMVFAGYRQVQCVGNTYSPDKDGKAWAHLVSATDSAGVYASFSATSEPGKSPFAVSPFRAASGASIGYNWFDGYTGLLHLGVTAENTRVRGVAFDTQFGVVTAAPTNLTDGGSYQLGLDVHNVFFTSAAASLAAHTFILPKFPVDGRVIRLTFDVAIDVCTIALSSEATSAGHTIRAGQSVFRVKAGDSVQLLYRESVSAKQWRRATASQFVPEGWFPTERAGVDYTGDTDSSAAFQALFDSLRGDFPSGKDYGRGGSVLLGSGTPKARDLRMSTWSGLVNQGPQPAGVLTMQHTATGAALIQIRDDSGQSQSIGSQPLFFNVALNGDRNNAQAGVIEDGVKLTDLGEGEKDDAPIFFNTIVANFSGTGINILPTHKQVRAFNVKSIAHGKYGLVADKSSDSKITQGGFGRSLEGQMKLVNCASFQLSQYDIWTPGSGTFLGKYACEWYGPRNVRFFQGEIQGAVYIEGDNSVPNAKRRHQELGCYFVGFNHKVSPETKAGAQGASYSAMVQIRGASGIHYALGTFGHSLGPADATDIAARPKNVWKFGVQGAGAYAGDVSAELGHVTVTSVEMLHMHGADATGVDAPGMTPEVPFTEHWASHPENVIWRTQKPGTLVEAPTAAPQKNWIALTGSVQTLDVAKYPLLYLALDNTRKLTTAGATFTIPATAGTLPAGFTKYIVAW